jgi:hypothetical protein
MRELKVMSGGTNPVRGESAGLKLERREELTNQTAEAETESFLGSDVTPKALYMTYFHTWSFAMSCYVAKFETRVGCQLPHITCPSPTRMASPSPGLIALFSMF